MSVSKSFDISSPYPSPWINESLRSRPLEWINLANSKLWFFPTVEGEQKLPGPTMWLHIVATDWSSGTQAREISPCKMSIRSKRQSFSATWTAKQRRVFCKKEETSTQERQRGEAKRQRLTGSQCPTCRIPSRSPASKFMMCPSWNVSSLVQVGFL